MDAHNITDIRAVLSAAQRAALAVAASVTDRTVVRAYKGRAGRLATAMVTVAAAQLGLPAPTPRGAAPATGDAVRGAP